jgi:putative ABC transport system permease protein
LNIGENTSDEAARQFKSMGTDLIIVQDSPTLGGQRKAPPLRSEDAQEMAKSIAGVSLAAPLSTTPVKTGTGGKLLDATAIGTTEHLMTAARLELARGRFISHRDGLNTVVVVGGNLATQLVGGGTELALGDEIRMDNYRYTVVGVLRSAPRNPLLPFDLDNALILPIKADRRANSATGALSNILLRVAEGHDPLHALTEVSSFLQRKGSNAQAQGALLLLDGMRQQGQMFKWMLGGVACISLLVGGIGIMNVMLAGIAERRREIGLRMAIGADQWGVMTMIVTEAVSLSFVGGGAGTLLGMFASVLYAWFTGWEPTLSALAALLGFGMSLLTGLFFGIYPAFVASKLSPIEALRSD